jgi:uncharacterized membrane protein AbrB (regulator of aidB expression)
VKNRNSLYIRVLLVVLSIVILLAFLNRAPQHAQRDTIPSEPATWRFIKPCKS